MRGRWLANLVLLVLVVLLGTAAQRELERDAPRLTGLDPDAITRVRIERPEQPLIALARTGEGWRIGEPDAREADPARVAALLRIAAAAVSRTLPPDAERGPLGLDPPRVRLTLDALTLSFGDTEPLAQRRYVAEGENIHLIDDLWWHLLTAPAESFVGKER